MTTDRTSYTAGLRALADLLDAHPEVPLPYTGDTSALLWILVGDEAEQREQLQAIARAIPGTVRKDVRDTAFDLHASLDGLRLQVIADREAVCERVVTGTREITREVPDPDALAAVPTTTITETVEDVEWVCAPLTAPEAVSA